MASIGGFHWYLSYTKVPPDTGSIPFFLGFYLGSPNLSGFSVNETVYSAFKLPTTGDLSHIFFDFQPRVDPGSKVHFITSQCHP